MSRENKKAGLRVTRKKTSETGAIKVKLQETRLPITPLVRQDNSHRYSYKNMGAVRRKGIVIVDDDDFRVVKYSRRIIKNGFAIAMRRANINEIFRDIKK